MGIQHRNFVFAQFCFSSNLRANLPSMGAKQQETMEALLILDAILGSEQRRYRANDETVPIIVHAQENDQNVCT